MLTNKPKIVMESLATYLSKQMRAADCQRIKGKYEGSYVGDMTLGDKLMVQMDDKKRHEKKWMFILEAVVTGASIPHIELPDALDPDWQEQFFERLRGITDIEPTLIELTGKTLLTHSGDVEDAVKPQYKDRWDRYIKTMCHRRTGAATKDFEPTETLWHHSKPGEFHLTIVCDDLAIGPQNFADSIRRNVDTRNETEDYYDELEDFHLRRVSQHFTIEGKGSQESIRDLMEDGMHGSFADESIRILSCQTMSVQEYETKKISVRDATTQALKDLAGVGAPVSFVTNP
eukprot:NODE_199_length_1218_cov_413.800684_g158_i0.p1 GENE.NODE_199_length_1218_cov_413.800684_g158_i0~~NODE_199_length_1218_cov_413.800684_g158_i0.p1  ORF type:complete len:288 (+),score=46.39 NODE_199_length_1218_cov_413.800684_g158_i0:104-967(+)